MEKFMVEEGRLIILKALRDQTNDTLNSELLRMELETFGISRERAWVHLQLDYLAEMGAVKVAPAGSVKIATLLELGARHLDRRVAIEGVKRPSREA